ncbi:hypothetical protein CY34DRAFT_711725 [Suillus luteus UH-Slu-Lm8-n1]|uniref:Uncharacterized protein n=1 Tax=Suillus luteus UH-Slu-Lm8-n1 TaxID=930992 RepID=A0A0C9Z7B4_9AGAM|nr:hypothetical protein CY34DRAFT_711725 [Suillus luteus UH-Slu-Lm8-n1]
MSEAVKCRQGFLGIYQINMTKNLSTMEREKFFDQVPVFGRHFTSHPHGWSGYAVHSVFIIHLSSLLARFSVLHNCFRHSTLKTARRPPFLCPFLRNS